MAPGLDRRTFLRAGALGTAAFWAASTPAARALELAPVPTGSVAVTRKLRVYTLVVDGLRPDEIRPVLMPRLSELRDTGTAWSAAQSLPVMETIPNHVMMATGVRPDRSGVPANSVYDREARAVRTLDRPSDLRFPTVLQALRSRGRTTGTVLSKEYLFGIFGSRANFRWQPFPLIPVSGHAPDAATVDAIIAMVDGHDPDHVFANLGDVDRFGHVDLTGTTLELARKVALAATDRQVGRFVDFLQETGRWRDSVVVVLADHSMDWSVPNRVISLTAAFEADARLAGRFAIAQNGGADLLYWTGSSALRTQALSRMRTIAAATDGVLSVHRPQDLHLGRQAGDLLAYARAGWRFTDPNLGSNPIPGNHGHPATAPIPFFVAGGHRVIRRGQVIGATARTVDVAPTVSWLFGLPPPAGGFDGTARTGAFTDRPARVAS